MKWRAALVVLAVFAAAAMACDDLDVSDDPLARTDPAAEEKPAKPKILPSHLQLRVERQAVPVCQRPFGLAPSPSGNALFVACAGSGQVVALDTEFFDTLWESQPLLERIYRVLPDPRRRRLYAIGMNGSRLHVLDTATGAVVADIPLGGNITDFALVPQNDRLVVTTASPPRATLVDLSNLAIEGHVDFPTPPGYLAIRPDGQLAAASSGLWRVKGSVETAVEEPLYLFDPNRPGRTLDSLGLGGAQTRQGLFLPDGEWLLVPERSSDTVAVFDVDERRNIRTIQVGGAPEKIVPTPNGRFAFTLDTTGASLTRLDLRRREADGYVVLSTNPQDLVVSPDGTELYAALSYGTERRGSVAVIDVQNVLLLDEIPAGLDPCCLAFSHGGRKLYVTNFLSDTVSVFE